MASLRVLVATIRSLMRRDAVAGEIRDEMAFHLAMRAEEYQRQGLTNEDARRAAARRFGNIAVMQDRGYDIRGGGVVETILQDIRYGARLLLRRPAFTAIAMLTLAMGIGLSTALFSVIDAALLRPLPYPHPEQLVGILVRETYGGELVHFAPSLADIRAWRKVGRTLAHVGAGRVAGFTPRIVDSGTPERLIVADVSEDFLEVFGIAPLLGRSIQAEDLNEGAPLVVLRGHAYWQSHFGGTSDVLGRAIRVDNVPATIVGVLPRGFYRETAVWVPTKVAAAYVNHRGSGTPVNARLRPGVTVAQAEQELTDIAKSVPSADPVQVVHVELSSMYDEETQGSSKTTAVLASAVALILLIACVNVAGLLLARGAIREPELAIRRSIGASRARVVRQLLTENLLLAFGGGLLGVFLAWVSLDAIVVLVPMSLPSNAPPRLNLVVLALAATVSIVSSLVFGLVPAIKSSRARIGSELARASRRHGSALSRRGGQLLIAAEVALAVVLLAGAGLMVRSFTRLLDVDLGFNPGAVLTMEVEPIEMTADVRRQYYPALLEALRALPGVAAVGAVDSLPLRDGYTVAFLKSDSRSNIVMKQVLPGYFEAIGQRLLQGRFPTEADRTGAEPVALINETSARRFFANGSPVGRMLETTDQPSARIIGVVGDVRIHGPEYEVRPELYYLYGQADAKRAGPMRIVLRPRTAAMLSTKRLRQIAQGLGPTVLVGSVQFSTEDVDQVTVTPRHRTLLLSLLGALGLVLTLVGIFSMTAYTVARRTQEIGIRMAFGARASDVVRAMVRDAAWPAFVGLSMGLLGALYETRILASFLFETTPHDPATFAAVAALMSAAALVAAWVPARRAAQVDPVIALRAE